MIRRSTTCPDGTNGWILISQIQHARLAGDVAAGWQLTADDPVRAVRAEWLEAIYHHDDGWKDWERHPQVDRTTGRPLNFTEMPLAESLAIWRGSIETALDISPLAAHMVAGHFLYLLERDEVHLTWRLEPNATCFVDFRAKGPAFCLAQSNGLGTQVAPQIFRANGPIICPRKTKWPDLWP